MKKALLPLILSAIVLDGCKTVYVNIGMPEADFAKKYRTAEMVEMSSNRDVYRLALYQNGKQVTKFFYFRDNKLYQVNEGVQKPDIIIQNQH